MSTYTMDEVKIDGNYPVQKILELSMETSVNKHGTLTYGGLISASDASKYINMTCDKEIVKIFIKDTLEFCGYPNNLSVQYQNNHYYLQVTLVTSSQLMDTDKQNRFYQDKSQMCKDILVEAYDDSKIGTLSGITAKDKQFAPILQYLETDWDFSLRMASYLCCIVVANPTSEQPQLTLGAPKRNAIIEENNISYSVCRCIDEFRNKNSVYPEAVYDKFLCYKLKSKNRYSLGDSVSINGDTLIVVRKNFAYHNGEILESYVLGNEQEFAVGFHYNKRVAGLELEGIVQDRKEQIMKLLLDIDSKRKSVGETWFSYSPVTNNGMYSMPLEDEKVMLQWQSDEDDDVLVVRPNRKNGHNVKPPSERHFLTEHENHLMMVPEKVEFTNPVGSIKWLESTGFDISTVKAVDIIAGRNIEINAKKRVSAYSPERTSICKGGTGNSIDMLGSELHIKAVKNVKISSNLKKFKKAKLPDRIMKTQVSESKMKKLQGATAR